MAGNFFHGTSIDQDGRWGKAEEKLFQEMVKSNKFPKILETKVQIKKVNIDIISKWITGKIMQLVGFEDEILINMVINLLNHDTLDGRRMQISLTPFLDKSTSKFMEELWGLLIDAQSQPSGIPSKFLEKKKEEILQREKLKSAGASNDMNERRIREAIELDRRRKREREENNTTSNYNTESTVGNMNSSSIDANRSRSRRHQSDERSISRMKNDRDSNNSNTNNNNNSNAAPHGEDSSSLRSRSRRHYSDERARENDQEIRNVRRRVEENHLINNNQQQSNEEAMSRIRAMRDNTSSSNSQLPPRPVSRMRRRSPSPNERLRR